MDMRRVLAALDHCHSPLTAGSSSSSSNKSTNKSNRSSSCNGSSSSYISSNSFSSSGGGGGGGGGGGCSGVDAAGRECQPPAGADDAAASESTGHGGDGDGGEGRDAADSESLPTMSSSSSSTRMQESGASVLMRVVEARGSNVFSVEDEAGATCLCLLPARFHKKMWLKKGSYVIMQMGAQTPLVQQHQQQQQQQPLSHELEQQRCSGCEADGNGTEVVASRGAHAHHATAPITPTRTSTHTCHASNTPNAEPTAPLSSPSDSAGGARTTVNAKGKGRGKGKWQPPKQHACSAPAPAPAPKHKGEAKVRGIVTHVLHEQHVRMLKTVGLWHPFGGEGASQHVAMQRGAQSALSHTDTDTSVVETCGTAKPPTALASGARGAADAGGRQGTVGMADDSEEEEDEEEGMPPLEPNMNRMRQVLDDSSEEEDE